MLISGKDQLIWKGTKMNAQKQIENICASKKEVFSEFLTCLCNCGLCEVNCYYKDEGNFYFHRHNDLFGINDLFIFFEDESFFKHTLKQYKELYTVSVITPLAIDINELNSEWKISFRRQFYKNTKTRKINTNEHVVLNKDHVNLISKSTSNTTIDNYKMSLEYDDECYAIATEELKSFLSTSKVQQQGIVEINWIYTEPQYRFGGYASRLLTEVSNLYVEKGFFVSYHCNKDNIASANTALKSGFTETNTEIILERK